ncbi:MAG: nucleotidyltransferase family protein [Candidatus Acidiferrales bacterium]
MRASRNISTCPEKQLLALCARTRIAPAVAEQIRAISARPLDWEFLLSEAAENSITPLVDRSLRAVVPNAIPAAEKDRLHSAVRANMVRCLFLSAELVRILESLRSQGIAAIPYKGPVAAVQAYQDVTAREFEDLDVILHQRDMLKANEAMLGLGYRAKIPWILSSDAAASLVPGEYNYRDEARRVMVELHTEITLRHFPVKPDLDDLAQRLVPVALAGHQVQTFSIEDALPILCIHGSKDFWERLSWIADVSELVQSYSELDWDAVVRRAESLRAQRMLCLGLALAAGVLDAPLPSEISRLVQADNVAAGLALEVMQRLRSRQPPRLDAGGLFQYRRRMLPRIFAGWRYAARLAVVPAEEDWLMVRLPPSLAPLYVALRPLRLLYKYGWAGKRA